MTPHTRLLGGSLCHLLLVLTACGDDQPATTESGSSDTSGASTEGTTEAPMTTGSPTTEVAPTTSTTSTTTSASTSEDPTSSSSGTTAAGPPAVVLPQAIAGAFWADPTTYPQIPVHVAATGAVDTVRVHVDDQAPVDASPGDGSWVASIAIDGLALGVHMITAVASGPLGDAEISAELVLGDAGMQWTDITIDGNAGTPVLVHRPDEDRLWLSWSDGSAGPMRRGWIEPIDGAGRSLGERIALTPEDEDVPYARAALGSEAVAVLYQLPGGGPYFNRLRVVGLDGVEQVAPIELEPPNGFGSFGGDIVYDGAAFVATFRSNDGMGGGDVWWVRIDEQSGAVDGPVKVASSGDGMPDGGFDPFSFVSIAAVDDSQAVITFVRERYNDGLALALPKGQLVVVAADGTVSGPDFIGSGTDFQWHWEARTRPGDDRVLLLWATDDLNDPNTTIPTAIRGAWVAPGEAVGHDEGQGVVLVQAPETRGEPSFIATAEAPGIVVWTDQRSYVDIQNGRIELMATRIVADDLAVDGEELFAHARFVAGTAHLGGAAAGTNAVITWIDERHGGSIIDPKPEVYLETVWR